MLVVFIDELMRVLIEERYLEGDTLTEVQENALQQCKRVITEVYADGTRVYTLVDFNYK